MVTYVAIPGQGDPVEDAHALWTRIRTNADKAVNAGPGDPNSGWLERSIESDGRTLFDMLGRDDFERYAVPRNVIRARLLLVVKPPTPQDRREAVEFVDRAFTDLVKRARADAPLRQDAPPPAQGGVESTGES